MENSETNFNSAEMSASFQGKNLDDILMVLECEIVLD